MIKAKIYALIYKLLFQVFLTFIQSSAEKLLLQSVSHFSQAAVEGEVVDKSEIDNIYVFGFDSPTIGFRCNKELKNH